MAGHTFTVDLGGGVPVVTAPEEIDITNAGVLRSALVSAAAHGSGAVVVDMTQTQFCDSSGLHTLLAAHKRASAEGRAVLLVMSSPAVVRVFTLTGIDQVIPNFTSLDQAVTHAASPDGRSGLASSR